jgi:hypothetical protein
VNTWLFYTFTQHVGARNRCFMSANSHELHPLRQVIPHPWGTDNSKTLFRASGPQKGELLKLLLMLLLRHLPPMLGIGRRVKQATGILHGQLSGATLSTSSPRRRAIFRTRPSASSRVEDNTAVFSTSTLDTLSLPRQPGLQHH